MPKLATCCLLLSLTAPQLGAQVTLRVHAATSDARPISGADVAVLVNAAKVLARGTTDAQGNVTISVASPAHENNVVIRKIGFHRVDRFFSDSGATASFNVVLQPVVRTLDAVKVTAQEDVARKSYFIDADAIEQSPRPVVDALDVVLKLRPDMVWGRQGRPDRIDLHGPKRSVRGNAVLETARLVSKGDVLKKAQEYGYCGPVSNIWVNGSRIRDVAMNPLAAMRVTGQADYIYPFIATVLASIKPEHIAEIEYHPCSDMRADEPPGSSNAIFVTLKDGIGYLPSVGSMSAERVSAAAVAAAAHQRSTAYRDRILGVFDETTGDPIADVEIVDLASGTSARTTSTGTITLAFLPDGTSQVRAQKDGYEPLVTSVVVSPADTSGVTLILSPRKR